ncbi:MAG: hypothetical protein HQK65_21970 [Desulfamplus sp.]|nr:hypothetical protein [Desulfamplus sp.]
MNSTTMQYPLQEKIGSPDLLVGREKEFKNFGKWIANIPKKLSKSRVILARRKSGKTAFIQRIFNQLWSANGMVIPFYFDISENKVWYPTFISHVSALKERISTQINIIPVSGGRSSLSGPGCTKVGIRGGGQAK